MNFIKSYSDFLSEQKNNHLTFNDFINETISYKHEYPEYWYHGTNQKFDKFTLDNLGKNYEQSILGIYFSQYLKPPPYGSTAKEYAENAVSRHGGEPYVYKCKININKPLILNSNGWYSSNVYIDKNRNDIINWLKNDNYDSVIVYDFETTNEDGIEFGDFILATKNIDIIVIKEIIKL